MYQDIARATATLGVFSANLNAIYEKALKHLDQHIRGTVDYELLLRRIPDIFSNDGGLTVYVDAGFTKNSTQKSTSGFFIYDRYRRLI